jgi:hypothetical protein
MIPNYPEPQWEVIFSDFMAEQMSEPSCGSCRFWRDRDGGRGADDKPAWCWRYPPTIMISDGGEFIRRDRPVMSGWEWCGEHEFASP